MAYVALALGTAYSAICIWLTVRIVNRRERWAKWTALVLSLPILYFASFGPACWISSHTGHGADVVSIVFQPLFSVWWNGPKPLDRVAARYATIFSAKGWTIAEMARYEWGKYP
jgi:hypothetical protein